VKTKLKRTLLFAAALLGAVGCGGNDGSGGAVTYVLFDHPVTVPPQFCTALNEGPVTVGNGSMTYVIDGVDAGTPIRAVIISDSFYSEPPYSNTPCGFPAGKTQLDVSVVGPQSGQIGVVADAYDFVVNCQSDTDCAFNLTWSATY
jgi:hypothetical protein